MNFFKRYKAWRNRPKSRFVDFIETLIIILPIAFVIRTYIYGLYQVPTGSMETTMLVGERFFADKFTPLFGSIKHGDIISFNDPNFDYSDNRAVDLFQRYIWGPANWTKRVIGMPGDYMVGKMEDGKPVIYRNGEKLDEPYVNKYPLLAVAQLTGQIDFRSYDERYQFDDQPFYSSKEIYVELAKKYLERIGKPWIKKPYAPAFDPNDGRNADIYDIQLGDNEYWVLGDNRLGSYDCRFWGGTGKSLDCKLIHGKIVFRLWSIDSYESWMIVDLIKHPISFWKKIRWNRFLQVVR